MIRGLILALCLMMVFPVVSRAADDSEALDPAELWDASIDQLRAHQDREVNPERRVMAFYYPWYRTMDYSYTWKHWDNVDPEEKTIDDSTHYPEIGAYDSSNPEVIELHMEQAKDVGIDTLIVSWWGIRDSKNPDANQVLEKILDKAEDYGLKISLYYEYNPSEGTGDDFSDISRTDPAQVEARVEDGINDFKHIYQEYSDHPAYLHLEGDPVLFVYSRAINQVAWEEWAAIAAGFKDETGERFALISDRMSMLNQDFLDGKAVFDGVHLYNFAGAIENLPAVEASQVAADKYQRLLEIADSRGAVATATVIPGYDDTKIRTPGIEVSRAEGELYQNLWEEALRVNPDWVLITSWNEWHEGTEIEPSIEHGDEYLELTREYSQVFSSAPERDPSHTGAELAEHQQNQELKDKYDELEIAIFGGEFNKTAYNIWQLIGEFDYLSYQDFAEGDISSSDYDILIYNGGEYYTRTVESSGDVDQALQEYLKTGGTLMALPEGPLPFFYDQDGEIVDQASQLGFSIHIPDTKPEETESPHFQTDPALTGLYPDEPESKFDYPAHLPRWRPAREADLSQADYQPLISLYDGENNHLGDGAAYIKHQEGLLSSAELAPGRTVYLWKGLLQDEKGLRNLYDVFYFLAEEL